MHKKNTDTLSSAFFFAIAALCLLLPSTTAAAEASRPSVLMLVIDDLRDTVGFLENFSEVETPNLDRLAERGVSFTNAHCAAPACGPSRTSFLTGLSPATTGVYENGQRWPEVFQKHVTLTRYFMDNGYYVAGSGKIYHGTGELRNFHVYQNEPWDQAYGEFGDPMGFPLDIPVEETRDARRVSQAIEYLEQVNDSPLFLACGIVKPHLPFNVPRKYYEMFPLEEIRLPEVPEGDLDDIPALGRKIALDYKWKGGRSTHKHVIEHDLWRKNIQGYLACVAFVDDQVGRILDAWDASPHSKNGIILLFSDHGFHLGEKEHWSKFTLWGTGTRVPLIVVAPGVTKPRGVSDASVSLLDIFPTLNALAGLPGRPDLDGLSIVPLLREPDLPWDNGAVTWHGYGNSSVHQGPWNYIHYRDGSKELYNLSDDPLELNNLAPLMEDNQDIRATINRLHRENIPGQIAPEAEFNGNRKSFFSND